MRHADRFTFQVADGADPTRAEKLKSPDVDAPEQCDWRTSFQLNEERRDERHADVDSA
jgi:hypothetical protein